MIVELRKYKCQPGKREAWVAYMAEVVVPFQTSQGMTVLGQFTAQDDDDAFYWIRHFDDEVSMKALSDKVYASEFWLETIVPEVKQMLVAGAAEITLLNPTSTSPLR